MPYSMLIDTTKCIGCQGCQVACKNWNNHSADKTTLGPDFGNPSRMNKNTWTVVKFNEESGPGGHEWYFSKQQCMHCNEPACVSACACGALKKTEAGPVVYDEGKCIGCRYCMLACPFGVPTFEWDKALPAISKCQLCSDRISQGLEPACSKTCPSQAILFGPREDILAIAEKRIAAKPGRYVNHIYGKEEAGGTAVMYLAGTEFENLELPADVDKAKYTALTVGTVAKTPVVGIGAAALLAGFFFISGRKDKNAKGGE